MDKVIEFIKARLGEKSTVITLVTLISGLVGYSIEPTQIDAITAVVASILALVGVFTQEKK